MSDQQPVPLLDINRENHALREELLAEITRVVDSGQFVNGPAVAELERAVAETCGTSHAIGCASGSDAVLLALMALGVGPDDEVICPSFTFFATASAIWRFGARPVFADIAYDSFNLDPESVRQAITSRTKAIIPVHLFGQAADMVRLQQIAAPKSIAIVEDAAQAIGAKFRDRPVGSWGLVSCFSFYPTKNLGALGDGGILTTNCDQMAAKLRLYAAHGMRPRYYHSVVGVNSRLDTMQAAALRVKLNHLDDYSRGRRANAERYHQMFHDAGLDRRMHLPSTTEHCEHVWNQYTIRVPDGNRDSLQSTLSEQKIGTSIYYPVPLHQQECFEDLGCGDQSLPRTEQAAREVLSLPIFPQLTEQEQRTVVGAIERFFASRRAAA